MLSLLKNVVLFLYPKVSHYFRLTRYKTTAAMPKQMLKLYSVLITQQKNGECQIINGFKRLDYRSSECDYVAVQYVGDEQLSVDTPHGNARAENAHPYVRTLPQVLQSQRETDEPPKQAYRHLSEAEHHQVTSAEQYPVLTKNTIQVKNTQKRERDKYRLTNCEMTNLITINDNAKLLQNEQYILETTILPHTFIACMSSRLARELQRL